MRNEVKPLIFKLEHIRLAIKEMRRAFEGGMARRRIRKTFLVPETCNDLGFGPVFPPKKNYKQTMSVLIGIEPYCH